MLTGCLRPCAILRVSAQDIVLRLASGLERPCDLQDGRKETAVASRKRRPAGMQCALSQVFINLTGNAVASAGLPYCRCYRCTDMSDKSI
jgi:uncharacterized membrane protein YccC